MRLPVYLRCTYWFVAVHVRYRVYARCGYALRGYGSRYALPALLRFTHACVTARVTFVPACTPLPTLRLPHTFYPLCLRLVHPYTRFLPVLDSRSPGSVPPVVHALPGSPTYRGSAVWIGYAVVTVCLCLPFTFTLPLRFTGYTPAVAARLPVTFTATPFCRLLVAICRSAVPAVTGWLPGSPAVHAHTRLWFTVTCIYLTVCVTRTFAQLRSFTVYAHTTVPVRGYVRYFAGWLRLDTHAATRLTGLLCLYRLHTRTHTRCILLRLHTAHFGCCVTFFTVGCLILRLRCFTVLV